MKNILKTALLAILMSVATTTTSDAFSEVTRSVNHHEVTDKQEARKLINRLNEIKEMDISGMTRRQKRELRKEVKSINHSLHKQESGIYISLGAAIIILLLLIILL